MKKVGIIGGAGFIGSYVTKELGVNFRPLQETLASYTG